MNGIYDALMLLPPFVRKAREILSWAPGLLRASLNPRDNPSGERGWVRDCARQ
jgi:hypothetical protein